MIGPTAMQPPNKQARRGVEARTLFPGVLLMTAMLQSDSEVSADCSEAPIVPRVSIYVRDRPGLCIRRHLHAVRGVGRRLPVGVNLPTRHASQTSHARAGSVRREYGDVSPISTLSVSYRIGVLNVGFSTE